MPKATATNQAWPDDPVEQIGKPRALPDAGPIDEIRLRREEGAKVRATSTRVRGAVVGALSFALTVSIADVWESDEAHAAGDWNESIVYPKIGGRTAEDWDFGSVNRPGGVVRWTKPIAMRFRGQRVKVPGQTTLPDGTVVSIGGLGGAPYYWVTFSRAGAPMATQYPYFGSDGGVTWKQAEVRRPLPIRGRVWFKYDVYERVRGRRGKWDCSVYYRDVCRWLPARKSVPAHRVDSRVVKSRVSTEIGPDKLYYAITMGDAPEGPLPSEYAPGLPIRRWVINDFCESEVCGAVPANKVQVKWSLPSVRTLVK